jgi:DNA-binding Xre family transcriptional regulator
MTVWKHMKEHWVIKKKQITDLGINADKSWDDITLGELSRLSFFLDVSVGDLVDY